MLDLHIQARSQTAGSRRTSRMISSPSLRSVATGRSSETESPSAGNKFCACATGIASVLPTSAAHTAAPRRIRKGRVGRCKVTLL